MQLSKQIRAQIVDAALAKSELPKRRAKVKAGLQKLAKLAHSLAVNVPPEIAALPEDVRKDWVRLSSTVDVYAEGFSRHYHFFSGDSRRDNLPVVITLDDAVLVPVRFGSVNAKDYPRLAKAAAELLAEHRAANAYEDDLRKKLSAIVASANTRDQLLKTWPEGKKFIPEPPVKSRALVDTKTVLEINETLGLK